MNIQRKKFTIATALLLGIITLYAPKTFAMNYSEDRYQVISPFIRLLFSHGNPKKYVVDDRFYFDTQIGQDDYYQICQCLYGEEISLTYFDRKICDIIKKDVGAGTMPRVEFCIKTKKLDGSHVYQNEQIPSIVNVATAQVYYADGTPALVVPMGSQLHVQEDENQIFFTFFHAQKLPLMIAKKDLFLVHDLKQLNKEEVRSFIVNQAKKLLGSPYQWGGQCACQGSGFDCTGFVQTIYRSCGQKIDRSVTMQFKKSTQIEPSGLQPGDLIFSYHYNTITGFKIIDHVMLFMGQDTIIHASPLSGSVTQDTFENLFGKKIIDCQNGESFIIDEETYFISCRSFFTS